MNSKAWNPLKTLQKTVLVFLKSWPYKFDVREVTGSSPVSSTKKERHAKACLSFWYLTHLTAEMNSAYENSPVANLTRDFARPPEGGWPAASIVSGKHK